jgi:NTP pyrophosphatase (non-canonical NTP hydrolase)
MGAGCPFITCALKKKRIEFCWNCEEHETCEKWMKHRESAKKADSFKCYQKLEDDIACIQKNGINEFEKTQKIKERLLNEMLRDFNDRRSKSCYCIAVTVMETGEIVEALTKSHKNSDGLAIKEKSKVLHSLLDEIARQKNYYLKLRK